MAKQYEEYRNEFEQIKKRVASGVEQIEKSARIVSHFTGVAGEGTKEVDKIANARRCWRSHRTDPA